MTTYYDSAEGEVISHTEAMAVLRAHRIDPDDVSYVPDMTDFYREFGTGGPYQAQRVLDWLGY